ncbi:hypothetical protein BRYFOR_05926 [Marvinbryantia formatexigens DSM 14469]|uniref:DUF2264 domain-containing protein n=1 Tax=Marvinbryantia formatexigens DSM 14469 TaxID=478749 RepID=C6LBD1_9FIRM|nr:DUF2264 domain-containing protein [Marvinbryantia formatexigens]EET62262.1 hypothetical protein BRYFOR_05926 [Marvinbryantia formatexigens DSM 14469]UWO26418.1 DUF2264 domain-containing protein [Marvinbryantia formatexigens DSM 14469]SDF81847.1 hypothetical protein SAMN05660368_01390 [Marvinbryantia formatexigens]
MRYIPKDPDYETSPFTGLTRKHWLEAAHYLLDGIFAHVESLDAPVLVPRFEHTITYPNEHTPAWKKQAEIFEGLARSFFIAAPLLKNEPEAQAGGIPLREYYKKQVLAACTPGEENYVLSYEDMYRLEGDREPLNIYQQTVETCALVICLWTCREVIWDTYRQEEKDRILDFIAGYACQGTVPQNWRLFNMLDMAFLHVNGREIDEDIMRHHASMILRYYAGDGWYRDGEGFDYYSVWAFQTYTPLWCLWYGYEKEPYLAAKFEEYSNRFMENYPAMFDRDGWVNMWGRSGLYKNAAVSAFEGNFFLKHPAADAGLARRICSGALMQFLGRDDVLYEGAPTLGFYRTFPPMLQTYSCAESPLWMAKAFLCLHLPADHPFWTEKEREGFWAELESGETRETALDGPGLCFAGHEKNGTTELRSGKVIRAAGDKGGICCYAKLSYSTKYPWEAMTGSGREAQMYILTDKRNGNIQLPNALLWGGYRDGVLYRRCFFNYSSNVEMHWMHGVDLADFPVAEGIVRVDRLRFYREGIRLTLGSYGFPDTGNVQVRELEKDGAKAIVLKGFDSQGREKQMAMTVFAAWEGLQLVHSTETNADAAKSLFVSAELNREKLYGYEPFIMVSQVITRESHEDFTEEEIFSVRQLTCADPQGCGGYGPVCVTMVDGSRKTVDFDAMEGRLLI